MIIIGLTGNSANDGSKSWNILEFIPLKTGERSNDPEYSGGL
jgi:hypothetical protein